MTTKGRVMVDPLGFRRFNPDCRDAEVLDLCPVENHEKDNEKQRERTGLATADTCTAFAHGKKGQRTINRLQRSDSRNGATESNTQHDAAVQWGTDTPIFTEEELLIASPVALGFSFSEKCWLEFSLSGIAEVAWNNELYESLVLPDGVKRGLTDLVHGHRLAETRTIDNGFANTSTGLNVVLHGPPGVGKTLTCEAIAEHLQCPLYVIHPGEISSSVDSVEQQLCEVFAMAQAWRAIVLLDDAGVFLEARQPGDIHRNSIISVVLRCLDSLQGVLFLVANQIETIDEALHCRLQTGVRYEKLSAIARRKIWQHHLGKVTRYASDDRDNHPEPASFSGVQYDELSKRLVNGREVCLLAVRRLSQLLAILQQSCGHQDL
jgi:hypothetical protein